MLCSPIYECKRHQKISKSKTQAQARKRGGSFHLKGPNFGIRNPHDLVILHIVAENATKSMQEALLLSNSVVFVGIVGI